MATNPLGSPRFRAFDSNGDPLSGGKLYTYEAGTTTPLSTYTTRAGSVANANPVILDADGEADVWMSPGVLYKFALYDSSDVLRWTVDNFPSAEEADAATDVAATDPGGRLSLTSATPVTSSDVTGATTVYYVPYKHDKVPLYDGSAWALHSIGTQISQTTTDNTKSPAAVTTDSNYDLFVWNDSGTVRLSRGPAWSSSTARGTGAGTTELEQVNGRYVNKVSITNGPSAQRGLYVGTIRSDGSSQINDSAAKRHTWNTYNQVARQLLVRDTTGDHTYSTATHRQMRANTANQLDVVLGLPGQVISARASVAVSGTAGDNVIVGIGLDSTSALATGCIGGQAVAEAFATGNAITASWEGMPGLGRHFLAWLQQGTGVNTQTWRTNGAYGIAGSVFA